MVIVSHRLCIVLICLKLIHIGVRERLDAIPEAESNLSFGNSVYSIRFEERHHSALYGQRYWFYLKDAVDDVPEYVVHWDNFVKSVFKLYVLSFY